MTRDVQNNGHDLHVLHGSLSHMVTLDKGNVERADPSNITPFIFVVYLVRVYNTPIAIGAVIDQWFS